MPPEGSGGKAPSSPAVLYPSPAHSLPFATFPAPAGVGVGVVTEPFQKTGPVMPGLGRLVNTTEQA